MGFPKLFYFGLFAGVNEWLLMTILRTHYFIDLLSGVLFAMFAVYIVEHFIYYIDYKVGRIREVEQNLHKVSNLYLFIKACHKCGWPQIFPSQFLHKEEIEKLQAAHLNNENVDEECHKQSHEGSRDEFAINYTENYAIN